MNPVTASIEDTLNNLPEDIREECISAIRNKRNNAFQNNQGNNTQNTYSGYQGSNNGQSSNQNKGQKKKNSTTSNYDTITCWFCNKKGHTQIECRTRIRQNKPLTCDMEKQGSKIKISLKECIGDIGQSESTIFSTLDLTSGFWQMPLHSDSVPKTAFTLPGLGQYKWLTSPMGLLGCPANFQRLMEKLMDGIGNVIVYIDDLLIQRHTSTIC
jgi:hypothetical protein